MAQRVNLQYTVDIDELPNETNRLVRKAHEQSKDCSCILSELAEVDDLLTVDSLERFEKARITLMNIDYALQDVQNIIKGFIAHKSGIEQNARQPEEPPSDIPSASLHEPQEIDFDSLEKQITSFTEQFQQHANANNDTVKE